MILQATAPDSIKVSGVVLDAENKKPIEGALISINNGEYKLITDKQGKFSIASISYGDHIINIKRLGYKSLVKQCHIEKDSCIETTFLMIPVDFITPSIIVSSRKYESKFAELSSKTSILEGSELNKDMGQSVASTLKNETSVAVRSMGPAPARPVIRGLGGNRIMIAQDGLKSNDLSSTSPDHAVMIEPYSADKIEIIRGPKSVIFSNSLSGGVINVEKNNTPLTPLAETELTGGLYYSSMNNGFQGNMDSNIPLGPLALSGMIGYSKSKNISSPKKTLENTSADHLTFSTGAGYSMLNFSVGSSFDYFKYDYGIPGGFLGGHPNGADIKLRKQDINLRMRCHLHYDILDNIELLLRRSYYHHTEYESNGSVAAEFVQRLYSGKVLFNQKKNEFGKAITLNGSYGFDINYNDRKTGGFVFTPPAQTINIAPFIFEDITFGSWYFQSGFRFSYDKYLPEVIATTKHPENVINKEFLSTSFSFSAMKNYHANIYTGINIYHSEIAPTLEDLYSEGPHLAAYSYEIGNSSLGKEKGNGVEIFSFYQNNNAFFMLTGFYNHYDSYIISRNSGEINYSILLPIYKAESLNAEIYGLEAAIRFNIYGFEFEGNISSVRGKILPHEDNLPMIPPTKGNIEVSYKLSGNIIGIYCDYAANQNRTDKFETPTKGYAIFGLFANYSFYWSGLLNSISLSIDNIFNSEYRNHLSRIKSIMPEPGRNLRLNYKFFL